MTEKRFAPARFRCVAVLSVVLGCLGLPALAQDASPPAGGRAAMRAKFEAANTTHDGHLTLAQAQAGGMRMVAHNFDAIDTDHQGSITLPQLHAFMKARREARQQPAPPP